MRDRLPTPGKENRVKITQDDGTAVEGVLSYADDATQEGSPYTKGNVLPDEVCNAYDLDTVTSEPKDAFLAVPRIMGKALLSVTVYKINGTPYPGVVIGGLTNIDTPRRTTNSNGNVTLYVDAGTYNLTFTPNPVCVDTSIPNKQVVLSAGGTGSVTTTETSNGTTALAITSSRTVAFSANVQNLDVFCVGGGGAGGYGRDSAGSGGGGGRTNTRMNVNISPYTSISATVGSGGGSSGNDGGTTRFGSFLSASGGEGGANGSASQSGNAGNGGSGGGGGAHYAGGDGGSNGSNGENGQENWYPSAEYLNNAGVGQGTTTKAFGEASSNELYSGGGGGGCSNSYPYAPKGGDGGGGDGGRADDGSPGDPNTGGGGGGGGKFQGNRYNGGSGGSGIIKLRWVNAS